jgi:hypothetical protein
MIITKLKRSLRVRITVKIELTKSEINHALTAIEYYVNQATNIQGDEIAGLREGREKTKLVSVIDKLKDAR